MGDADDRRVDFMVWRAVNHVKMLHQISTRNQVIRQYSLQGWRKDGLSS